MQPHDRQIDFKNLIYHVVLKWKVIVIFLIAGLVLGGGFSAIKNKQNISSPLSECENMINSTRRLCNEEQIDAAQSAFAAYQRKIAAYEVKKQLLKDSLFMNLEPENIWITTLSYLVENNYLVDSIALNSYNNAADIAFCVQKKLTSEEICNQIRLALGTEVENQFLYELITCESVSDATFDVKITTGTKEEGIKIASVIKENIDDIEAELKEVIGELSIHYVAEQTMAMLDESIADKQDAEYKALNSLKTEIEKASAKEAGLSGNEAEFYEALVDYDKVYRLYGNNIIEQQKMSFMSLVSKKYALFGAVGLAALAVAGIILIYLISSKVKTLNDISDVYEIPVIGVLASKSKKKAGPDVRLIRHLFYKTLFGTSYEEKITFVAEEIKFVCQISNLHKIHFVLDLLTDESENSMVDLKQKLVSYGISATYGESIAADKKSLVDANEAGAIVFVETMEKSKLETLRNNLNIACVNKTQILGCIAMIEQ